jgi:hypothetical protein
MRMVNDRTSSELHAQTNELLFCCRDRYIGGSPKGLEKTSAATLSWEAFISKIRSPSGEEEAGRWKGNEAFRRVICSLEMKDYNINGVYLTLCREI